MGLDWKWVEENQRCEEKVNKDGGIRFMIARFRCPIYPGKWEEVGPGSTIKCARVRKTPTCPANFVWDDDHQYCTEKKKELKPGEFQTLELALNCPTGPGNWTWKGLANSCVQSSVKA